jgi:hypothetical protein
MEEQTWGENKKSLWIQEPTIKALIIGLQEMELNGVSPDALLDIAHLVNMPGVFVVSELGAAAAAE